MNLTTSQLKEFLKKEIKEQMANVSNDAIDTAEIAADEEEEVVAPQQAQTPQWASTRTTLQQAASGNYRRGPFLRAGHQGQGVRQIQRALNANGYELKEDGKFGGATHRAVIDFQKRTGAKHGTRGLVGPETGTALLRRGAQQPQATQAAPGAAGTPAAPSPAEVELQFDPNKPPRHQSKSPLIKLLRNQKEEDRKTLVDLANRWRKEHNMNDDQLAAALIKSMGDYLDMSDKPVEKPEEEATSPTHAALRALNPFGD